MENLNDAGAIGVFAIFALMVIDRILDHRKTLAWKNGNGQERRLTPPENCPIAQPMATQIAALHELHTVKDLDGVTPLARISRESRAQTELLGTIAEGISTIAANGAK